jgi:hypothetical protein
VPPAPRARGAVLSFDAAVRRVRATRIAAALDSGATRGEGGPPGAPHRTRGRGALARALLLSLAVHALAIAGLATFVGLGGSGRDAPFAGATLVATLATPPKSAPPVATPVPAPSPIAPTAQAASTAPLPVPLEPKRHVPAFKGSPQGMVTINLVGEDHPVDPGIAALIAQFHTDAIRGTPEFDVQPRGIYPLAAVEKRLQIDFLVPIVVLEDGRVEIANGTFDDPLFGPAILAGLRVARARPAVNAAGRTVPLWSVLSFAFEFAGDRTEPK